VKIDGLEDDPFLFRVSAYFQGLLLLVSGKVSKCMLLDQGFFVETKM